MAERPTLIPHIVNFDELKTTNHDLYEWASAWKEYALALEAELREARERLAVVEKENAQCRELEKKSAAMDVEPAFLLSMAPIFKERDSLRESEARLREELAAVSEQERELRASLADSRADVVKRNHEIVDLREQLRLTVAAQITAFNAGVEVSAAAQLNMAATPGWHTAEARAQSIRALKREHPPAQPLTPAIDPSVDWEYMESSGKYAGEETEERPEKEDGDAGRS